jgi:formylglycine-generating enzyme required for sulfatase activity
MDMAGNVLEWCSSIGYYKYKPGGPEEDGSDSLEGDQMRALRGGSWNYDLDDAPCASRVRLGPNLRDYFVGFRVAESALPGFGSAS